MAIIDSKTQQFDDAHDTQFYIMLPKNNQK